MPTRTGAHPAWPGATSSACRPPRSRPRPPAKTSRCCSPTRRAPRSWSRWAPTPPWSSSSTKAVAAWPRRSSPGSRSAVSWSTPRASAGSIGTPCPAHPSCCSCSRRSRRWPRPWRSPRSARHTSESPPNGGTTSCSPCSPDRRSRPVINFRYHVVSLTAVFLALAIGLVVGTAALNGPLSDALKNQVGSLTKQTQTYRERITQLESEAGKQEQFTGQAAPFILAGRLPARKVLVVSLSQTADSVAKVVADLKLAGATITGQVEVQDKFFDPASNANLLDVASGA